MAICWSHGVCKTAVVIVHGIGEQRPMATVRGFVRFFAGRYFRNKTDPGASLFELRRLSTYASDEASIIGAVRQAIPSYPADTVFYEFYWAYHYRDTQIAWVIRWMLATLRTLRKTGSLCALRWRLKVMLGCYFLVLLGLVLAATAVIWGFVDIFKPAHADPQATRDALWGVLKVIGGTLLPALLWLTRPVILGSIGDAARYFGTSPNNPIERQQIRAEGAKLLKRLHQQRDARGNLEYAQIVVVGHSLGSVVAYDILRLYWGKVHRQLKIRADNAQLETIEKLMATPEPPTASAGSWDTRRNAGIHLFRKAQWRLRESIFATDWRVSDLVTLGSPLTYARALQAENAVELQERQLQRELPTCPPTRDQHPDQFGRRSCVFSFEPITSKSTVVPDHGAMFLLTRWTNIYFPNDPIGGPVGPIFGWGVYDIEAGRRGDLFQGQPCSFCKRTWATAANLFGYAHNRYWELTDDNPKHAYSRLCATRLRRIVRKHWHPNAEQQGRQCAAQPA
jgi:hypothetical protein